MAALASTLVVVGDWDDVDASVEAAMLRSEMAIRSRRTGASPEERVFILQTLRDEPATLTARHDGERITLTASVGRVADPARERELLMNVAARLEQLRGVDFAPIR